jgi:integrase
MADSRKLVKTSTKGIYRRGDTYVVRYRDPSGKPRKRCARTLAQARALRAELCADVSRGEYRVTSRITFADYGAGWIESFTGRTARGIRPDTLKRYRADLDRVIVPHFGRWRLAEIEPRHLKAFVAKLFDQGLSASRVRNIYAPLRGLLRTAVEEGVIRYDPTAGVRITRVGGDECTDNVGVAGYAVYSVEDVCRFLDALPDQHRLLGRFLVQTGLRISEALALRWQDIDLGKQRVQVTRRLFKGTFAPPKSRYGRRSVPLNTELAEDLWQARKHTATPADDAPVFPSSSGGYMDYDNVYDRILVPAQRRAGLKTGAHILRHTCATMLFQAGWNAKQVQVFLGHHSPAFTLATYVHLLPDDLPLVPEFATPSEASRPPIEERAECSPVGREALTSAIA